MYQIYYSRYNYRIDVKPLSKTFKNGILTKNFLKGAEENPGNVVKYNDCYSLSTSRKALLEFSREIKEKWISELKDEISRFESIKI